MEIIEKEMTGLLKILLCYKTASDVFQSNLNNSRFLSVSLKRQNWPKMTIVSATALIKWTSLWP